MSILYALKNKFENYKKNRRNFKIMVEAGAKLQKNCKYIKQERINLLFIADVCNHPVAKHSHSTVRCDETVCNICKYYKSKNEEGEIYEKNNTCATDTYYVS